MSFQRTFSDLGKYQQAYTVFYQLEPCKMGYLIPLKQGDLCDQVTLETTQEEAMQILALLYENAVTMPLWRDVLESLSLRYIA